MGFGADRRISASIPIPPISIRSSDARGFERLDGSEVVKLNARLHDIESGCLARLPSFLAWIADLGYAVEQGFADRVVVTRAGRFVTLAK